MTDDANNAPRESGISERLIEAVDGRKVSSLARASGISISVWYRTLNGANSLNTDSLLAMAKVLNVDPGWLLTGNGTARTEDQDIIPVNTRLLSARTKQLLAIFNKASVALSASLRADADNY